MSEESNSNTTLSKVSTDAETGAKVGTAVVWVGSAVTGLTLIFTLPVSGTVAACVALPYLYFTYQFGRLGGALGWGLAGTGSVAVQGSKKIVQVLGSTDTQGQVSDVRASGILTAYNAKFDEKGGDMAKNTQNQSSEPERQLDSSMHI